MKKAISNIVVIAYIVIAIFVTVCLLSYNDNKITEFGDKSLIIIDSNSKDYEYKKGDLIITNKTSVKTAKEGDDIFFYDNEGLKIAEILKIKDFGEAGLNFIIDGDYTVVEDDVAGSSNEIKVMHNLGNILSILESKWGFLFLIVFPSLLAFLYEIYELMLEISNQKKGRE